MAPPAGEVLNLTDDLLGAILILLPLADLGRACASCAAFRRVITSPSFLRRLHALHPPSLLGFRTFFGSFRQVDPPHPSAAAARALAGAADFRFSFLPNPGFWVVRYVRAAASLSTTVRAMTQPSRRWRFATPCSGATCFFLRSLKTLQPPSSSPLPLGAPFPGLRPVNADPMSYSLPAATEEAAAAAAAGQPQPFRVIWIAQCASKLVAFVFSSASRQWRAISSPSSCDLDPNMPALMQYRCLLPGGYYTHMAASTVFKLLVLDMSTMEFSSINSLPEPCCRFSEFAIVELGESRRGMFLVAQRNGSGLLQHFCANGQSHVIIRLKAVGHACVRSYKKRQPHLMGHYYSKEGENMLVLQDNFRTSQFQKVRQGLVGGEGDRALPAPYTGYPPSLASPTI
uniref:F-box domain-containing protein n=1 Tax=Setaria viridis TaxID=4556 RepID=A0A4U6U3D9_SETVI|nr:hypothetical protein SEVIR_7G122600v2 [Setaria viridis]